MRKIKIITLNLLVCFFIFLLFEFISGDYIRGKQVTLNHNYLVINKDLEYEVNLYTEKHIKIKYSRDEYGFKDRFKDIHKVDIITVGGSTTEQRYVSIEKTWPDILEKKINKILKRDIDIINAGISGQSSKGHIWNFNKWFKYIEDLKPKYIIFYIGINESDSDQAKGDPQPYQLNTVSIIDKIKKYLKINNGLTYKIYLKFTLSKSALLNVWHDPERYNLPYIKIKDNAERFKNSTFQRLEERLEILRELTDEIGAIPIFVTQKTLRWKNENGVIFSIDNQDYYYNEKKISETIINFCKKNNLIFIDGFNNLNFKKKDTWDLVHMSPSGSRKIADLIFNKIEHNLR